MPQVNEHAKSTSMKRKLVITCALAGLLNTAGCDTMSTTEKRTLGGAALGGAVAGAITGDWGWAVGGAAIGAVGGYIYDQHNR